MIYYYGTVITFIVLAYSHIFSQKKKYIYKVTSIIMRKKKVINFFIHHIFKQKYCQLE